MEKYGSLVVCILLSQIFIIEGLCKIAGYAGTQGYMNAMGVPGALLPLVILLELGGGLAILFGFRTKLAALILALFCIVSALIFHNNFADGMQKINFMKNLAIAGGFLLLSVYGAGAMALDNRGKSA
ncbi:MAG: DoxX family protein [Candidatus Protistobacter heckmanni]|nr:DoxX family protein [Candidatus Protistobacter heckmanni]